MCQKNMNKYFEVEWDDGTSYKCGFDIILDTDNESLKNYLEKQYKKKIVSMTELDIAEYYHSPPG